MIINHLGFTWK